MSGVNGGNQDVDIDLSRIIAAVWDRKVRILGVTVVAAAVALVGASLVKPSYMGETRVLIESRSPNLSGAEAAAQANDPLLDSLNVTSQAQLLQSSDLIKRVVRDLGLAKLEEFDPAGKALIPNPLVMIGLKQDPMKLNAEDRVIEEFREKLHVYAVENSRVIAIEFSSHDPKLASDIPNQMAEVYLEFQSGAKQDTHSETAKWLEPEIANLTERVREAEKKVADYRSANGLFQTTETSSLSTQQLNNISAELTRVRAERANAEARAENVRAALKAGRSVDTLSDVVGSQVIQRLKEAEANLQAQISDSATSLLEGHPRLKGLRAQLAGIRQQIDSETRKILTSLDNEAELSRIRERQLMSQLNGLKADSARAGEEEVGLRALEREAAAQRQLLETYLARYRQATSRLESNSTPADARVVSRAVEPSEPYFPKIIPIVVVVSLVTFILGCLLVVITELFSGRALRPLNPRRDEVAPADAAPVVAAPVPVAVSQPERVRPEPVVAAAPAVAPAAPAVATAEAVAQPESTAPASVMVDETASEDPSFTIDAVAHYLQRYAVPVAIAVSPSGDAGSTATVVLAREIAQQGRSVVLIDMTGSACPTRLMAESRKLPGITDLLCGETAFGDAIHPDRLSSAHIIPQGVSDPARAMRGADRLTMIIDALADAYDLVVIECGPAEADGLSRLTRKEGAEIVLSVPGFKDEDVAALVLGFEEAGYPNLLVMSEATDRHHPRSGRRAA
ncbi:chain-length determining protein [Neorhizobium sp. SOG26]|uniref:GumC family protein n=1 Tax=Neorhizobium sp. SOG26 TaxID=2060726 RepID=UPI000E58DC7A|nr:exopolysaccharide transport family protein [Neorhizobium sp. SOG26]AXV14967.1 chain-length determining protein [Neorhizobium sp. SOG26]